MFKRIVVPLDGTPFAERALVPARALAIQAGVPVELVTSQNGGVAVWPEKYLREAGAGAGIEHSDVRVGHQQTVSELLEEITTEDESLVCMTSHTRSGLQEAILGCTADDLVRRVDATFLISGPSYAVSENWRVERMLVCTDGSETAHAIIAVVGDWLRAMGPSARAVQVIPPAAGDHAENSARDVSAQNLLRAFAAELAATRVDWDVLHSDHPSRAIVDDARTFDASVVAMATHGRSGLDRITVGSVAGALVRHAPCPVLVVRPDLDAPSA
jgi:nucleotide-binding universal stress UspA family protein